MKKILIGISLFIVVSVAAVYWLIPSQLAVSESLRVRCVADAAYRAMSDQAAWAPWWPGSVIPDSGRSTAAFDFDGNRYLLTEHKNNTLAIGVQRNAALLNGRMSFYALPGDSMLMQWTYEIASGSNPWKKIAAYRQAVSLKNQMHTITDAAATYLVSFRHLYGFPFLENSTRDTLLISTRAVSAEYPSTSFIYGMIGKLQAYALHQGCTVTGRPMINISHPDQGDYRVMAALPVDRVVNDTGDIAAKKMIPGKFLVVEVTGTQQKVDSTLHQIENYFQDYRRTPMAIPFAYLVTDRRQQPDSTKWVTLVYAPVF